MAAGLGSRFGKRTESIPKCFIEVHGVSMIERSIEALIDCGIEKIIIGTGYRQEAFSALGEQYPEIRFCYNPRFAETNSMWTLYNCRDLIGEGDFLLLESDLVYEKKALLSLIEDGRKDLLLASAPVKFQDAYYVSVNKDNVLNGCSTEKGALEVYGEFVGIHKLSARFYAALCSYFSTIMDTNPRLGYEYGLLEISSSAVPMFVKKVADLIWYEIDDEKDLNFVEETLKFKS